MGAGPELMWYWRITSVLLGVLLFQLCKPVLKDLIRKWRNR